MKGGSCTSVFHLANGTKFSFWHFAPNHFPASCFNRCRYSDEGNGFERGGRSLVSREI